MICIALLRLHWTPVHLVCSHAYRVHVLLTIAQHLITYQLLHHLAQSVIYTYIYIYKYELYVYIYIYIEDIYIYIHCSVYDVHGVAEVALDIQLNWCAVMLPDCICSCSKHSSRSPRNILTQLHNKYDICIYIYIHTYV